MSLISTFSTVSNKGLPQIIEKYASPNGKNYVKVVKTNLGDAVGKRTIAYKSNGPLEPKATKIIDNVYGGKDVYTPSPNGGWQDKTGAEVFMKDKTIAWG